MIILRSDYFDDLHKANNQSLKFALSLTNLNCVKLHAPAVENVGKLTDRLLRIFHSNPAFANVRPPCFAGHEIVTLDALLPIASQSLLDFVVVNSPCVLSR